MNLEKTKNKYNFKEYQKHKSQEKQWQKQQ